MPNCNIIKADKLTMESIDRLLNDIVSNQRLDDDMNIHNFEYIERFDLDHNVINRHNGRVIKSKYRKLNKKRNR